VPSEPDGHFLGNEEDLILVYLEKQRVLALGDFSPNDFD